MTWMLDFVEEILYAFARLANIALAVFSKGLFSGQRSSSQDCVLGYFLSSLTGLFSGLRSSSQDCVLGYFRSSLTGLVFGLRSSCPFRPLYRLP
jgi:hypothetical protein